jgi:two-component system sensor histidine kinase PilS (NtrC family)
MAQTRKHTPSALRTDSKALWQALYYFNLYRLVLATGFSALALGRAEIVNLGERSPWLFLSASIAMLVVSVGNTYTITQGRPAFHIQAYIQFTFDVVFITVLAHASGGISSGLSLLLIVSVAASGVVLTGRMAIVFAAAATLITLADHGISLSLYADTSGSFTQFGFLGIGLFSTGILLSFVSDRIRRAQALADRRAAEMLDLAKLNELIVARLQTGILVTDKTGQVRLFNLAIKDLLGVDIQSMTQPFTLETISVELSEAFEKWKRTPHLEPQPLQLREHGPNALLRFVRVTEREGGITAIFLEDMSQTERQAQQLKLAALGRLTAAIAHEIRNPLSAISHASQLINESPQLKEQDRQLTRIINDNTDRLDQIIKAILQLGRPRSSNPVLLHLNSWLHEFRTSFVQTQDLPQESVTLENVDIEVCMDPDQLHQVLVNLCQNAIRYSPPYTGHPVLVLEGGWNDELSVPYLDVVDRGSGVPTELQDKIFEPFFTAAKGRGTGLGLYLSRALCENNYGRLDYIPMEQPGSRFRIQFAPNEMCRQST